MVGDGVRLPELRHLAARVGCSNRVRFLGQLATGAVRQVFDESHLFVLPSRQEGLPRAMLEAMARALPCVASAVGGVPEIIDAECLVPVGDINALANKISMLASNRDELARQSARNLARSRDFSNERLSAKREAFLEDFRRIAEARLVSNQVIRGAALS
jgi:glycosyltransferase involved in cell wall biosynthesis